MTPFQHIKIATTHRLLVKKICDKDRQDRGYLRTYAYFLQFKYLFTSSKLHKANHSVITELTGYSDKTVRVQLGKMRKYGWTYRDAQGHLIFKTFKQMYCLYKLQWDAFSHSSRIAMRGTDGIKEVIARLMLCIVENNIKQQEYMHQLREELKDDDLLKGRRWYPARNWGTDATKTKLASKIYLRDLGSSERAKLYDQEKFTNKLSCFSFGKLFGGRKRTAGFRIKHLMTDLDLITLEVREYKMKLTDDSYFDGTKEYVKSQNHARFHSYLIGKDRMQRFSDLITPNPNFGISPLLSMHLGFK